VGCGKARPPSVQVAAAHEIGVVGQSSLIVGRDGGWGAKAFGHLVFAFGDTFVSKADTDGSNFHSNSFSWTEDVDASDGIGGLTDRVDAAGSPLPLLAPTAEEAAFNAAHRGDPCQTQPCGARWATWIGAHVFDGTRSLVSYGLIYAETGAFNFHSVGQSLAVWNDFTQQAERPVIGRCPDHPTLLFCQDEPAWGSSLLLDNGVLYSFACSSSGCLLSRVDPAHALEHDQWQAWNGSAWGPLSGARTVFDGSADIMRVFPFRGGYMAVYSVRVSDDVAYRTAPAITGPWSDATHLFTAKHKANDGGWTYDALAQPDYSGDAVLYVTHSRPTALFSSELALWRIDWK
jgi:hypothetical protein